jgi:uncharacterized membrane protein YphA (DoxX/SURF4 family)
MRNAIAWILRLGLGALFVYAGIAKLADPVHFADEIANYHFFPSLAPILAATLPMIEVLLGMAIVIAPIRWRQGAALGIIGLMAVFTVAVSQAVGRGINVSCGCFGGASGPVTGITIARDLALLAAAIALFALGASSLRRAAR